jgi:hypothetical protein
VTQRVQLLVQNRLIGPVLAAGRPVRPPWLVKTLVRLPWLRRMVGRVIGLGVRPEAVAPEIRAGAPRV